MCLPSGEMDGKNTPPDLKFVNCCAAPPDFGIRHRLNVPSRSDAKYSIPSPPHIGNTLLAKLRKSLRSVFVTSLMLPLLTFITAIVAAALPRYSLRHVDGRLRLNAMSWPS